MPPLVFTPGQRSFTSGSASMNAFAKPLCSSIPVATASTFTSKTMSSGGKPTTSSRNASSPSFRLSELTMPLPCRHFSPASRTLQRELSTTIGSRAISGSVAMRFKNRVIADGPSSRSASMFTSRRFAPPRTCSSATSSAAE